MASPALKCTICPSTPTFSDLSHLLTHVGSKGHLSHHFKLRVNGATDPDIQLLLAGYDHWEIRLDLKRLLAERMSAKATKDTNRAKRSRKPIGAPNVEPTRAPVLSTSQAHDLMNDDDNLDPRLSQSQLAGPELPTQSSSLQPRVPAITHGSEVSTYQTRFASHRNDDTESEGDQKPNYPDPLKVARSLYPPRSQTTESFSDSIQEATSNSFTSQDVENDDTANLKGVLWPGMGIFDSASNEMKRKRNQRKDGSILQQMMITSETVEPTEIIYSPSGEVKKRRYISGNVEISSPLKGESPLMKKRVTRSKPALDAADTNMAIGGRRGVQKLRTGVKHQAGLQQLSNQALPFVLTSSPPVSRTRNTRDNDPTKDEEEEFKLTIRSFNNQKGNGLNVYDDRNVRGQGVNNSVPSRTGSMAHPMSAYPRFPPPQSQAYPSFPTTNMQTLHHPNGIQSSGSQSLYRKPANQIHAAYEIGGSRENFGSMMGHPRLQPPSFSGDHNQQLYVEWAAGSHHLQPLTYTTPTAHMTFGAFTGASAVAQTNPLAFAFQNPFAHGNPPRTFESPPGFHITSPQMTRQGMSNPAYTGPSPRTASTETEEESFYGGKAKK